MHVCEAHHGLTVLRVQSGAHVLCSGQFRTIKSPSGSRKTWPRRQYVIVVCVLVHTRREKVGKERQAVVSLLLCERARAAAEGQRVLAVGPRRLNVFTSCTKGNFNYGMRLMRTGYVKSLQSG